METESTTVVEQPQVPILPLEEQLKALQTEKDRLTLELESAKKGQVTLSQNLRKREEALNSQNALKSELESVKEQFKILAGYVSESKGGQSGDYEEASVNRAAELKAKFEKIEAERLQKAKIEADTQVVVAFQNRVEALGLTENDENYYEIKNLVTSMNPDNLRLADIKIKKIEESKMTKPVVKTETEDEKIARLVEAGIRKRMQDDGLLTPEGGSPSAATNSFKKIEEAYNEGKITIDAYKKARKEQGIQS
jgi:hypothetical protein